MEGRTTIIKKMALSFVKCITFFVGWAVAASLLPLPPAEDPAVWRLWAELIPLLAIMAFTLLFWLLEGRRVPLRLVRAPGRGLLIGAAAGVLWLAAPTLAMYAAGVIQMEGVAYFTPNDATDPAFGAALRAAAGVGVNILAWDCRVTEDSMCLRAPVPVRL